MSKRVQLRRGTTAQHATFVGAVGEVTVDTTKKALVVHDGATLGGIAVPTFANTATETALGVAKIATTAIAQEGTNDTDFITSKKLRDALNAAGSAPVHACRAWVNFNGTGTPSIRASGNVSSITDNGVGDYTINFTTAMPDANYVVTETHSQHPGQHAASLTILSTGSVQLRFSLDAQTLYQPVDPDTATVGIIR